MLNGFSSRAKPCGASIIERRRWRRFVAGSLVKLEQLFHRVQVRLPQRVRTVAFAESLHRIVQELVDDAAGEIFKVLALDGGDLRELVDDALDFLARELVMPLIKSVDHRAELADAGPTDVALDLIIDDFSRVLDRFAAMRMRGGDDLLEIVEVVEIDILDLADRRLDV